MNEYEVTVRLTVAVKVNLWAAGPETAEAEAVTMTKAAAEVSFDQPELDILDDKVHITAMGLMSSVADAMNVKWLTKEK